MGSEMCIRDRYLAWSTLAMLRKIALGESVASPSVAGGANLCAIELYMPRHCASAATMEAHYGCSGLYTNGLHTEQCAACGEDEDAASMTLTATHRLLRRCGVRPAEVGVLHLGASLLDRSKSMKTELMALVEAGDDADLEGVDHYGAPGGGTSALLSCVSWAQGDGWDGRWGVVVCSNDQVAPIGLPLSSASATAVLVGRGAPLQMGDASVQALAQPCFVSWLRMAALPAGEPSQEAHKGHEMRATVHVGSRGEACRWSANRAVERVSADQTSLSQPSPAFFRTPHLTL